MIQLNHVNHYYGEGQLRRQVLFDCNATVGAEMVMLTGPSGSGKSTLLTLLGALRSPQEGEVQVLGKELNGATAQELVQIRREIGFIFQSCNLLAPLSAIQNIEAAAVPRKLARGKARAKAKEMLRKVGLEHRADHLPEHLSGGERQRVAVARALAGDPKFILADEPTAALDSRSGRDVACLIRDLTREQQCGALIVTHDPRILDLADRVMRIEDGRLEVCH